MTSALTPGTDDALPTHALVAAKFGAWEVSTSGAVNWDSITRALHGADPTEVITPEAIRSFVHPDDWPLVTEAVRNASAVGGYGYYELEYRIHERKGTKGRWVRSFATTTEINGVVTSFRGIVQDITAHKRQKQVQDLLAKELKHRTQNVIGMIQSIARRTFSHAAIPHEMHKTFEARLNALARSQQILDLGDSETLSASLYDVVSQVTTSFREKGYAAVSVTGPLVKLSPQQAIAVSLILHELHTNAVKYGALSNEKGVVTIAWSVIENGASAMLNLVWSEAGGPPVIPPDKTGFGTTLIKGILNPTPGSPTKVTLEYLPTGVICTLRIGIAGTTA